MKIISLEEIRGVFNTEAVLSAGRAAFIGHFHQRYVTPMPGQLLFDSPPGDCHIKFGYRKSGPIVAIKIATGFYENAYRGLPVNSGMVLVLNRETGIPLALLQDEGWLTSWRTAAAGTLAASLAAPLAPEVLGIFGAGHQAELQAHWITKAMGIREIRIWARNTAQSQQLAYTLSQAGLEAKACQHTCEVLDEARLVVTTTPSKMPLFPASEVHPGTHIIALGADGLGKQELDPLLFKKATLIATDDHEQCLDHGDFAHAVKGGYVRHDADQNLGLLLENFSKFRSTSTDISIVDLTGIPAQDVENATTFCRLLGLLDFSP